MELPCVVGHGEKPSRLMGTWGPGEAEEGGAGSARGARAPATPVPPERRAEAEHRAGWTPAVSGLQGTGTGKFSPTNTIASAAAGIERTFPLLLTASLASTL